MNQTSLQFQQLTRLSLSQCVRVTCFIVAVAATKSLAEDAPVVEDFFKEGGVQIMIFGLRYGIDMPERTPYGLCVTDQRLERKAEKPPRPIKEMTRDRVPIDRQAALDAYKKLINVKDESVIMALGKTQRLTIYGFIEGWSADGGFAKSPEIVSYKVEKGALTIECTGSGYRHSREKFGESDYLVICELDVNLYRLRNDDGKAKVVVIFQPDKFYPETTTRKLEAKEVSTQITIPISP